MVAMPRTPTVTDPPNAGAQQVVRLVLIDRDALARRAMREALTIGGEFVVAAEAAGEDDAIAIVADEQPDLVLIDIGYPRLEGIALGKEMRRRLPDARIVFCSISDDEDTAVRALRAGALGYVRKDLDYGPMSRGAGRSTARRRSPASSGRA